MLGEGVREVRGGLSRAFFTLNNPLVPLKYTEYGFGYSIIRSPYTPYSVYLRGGYPDYNP